GVGPWMEAAAGAVRPLCDPHLLVGRPVVRSSLAAQQRAAVLALEREVHLAAAVVGRVGVSPGSLVPVDAAPGAEVRRTMAVPPCPVRLSAPGLHPPASPLEECCELGA